MSTAKDFFQESERYHSKCELRKFMATADNCEAIGESFIDHSYDASTGQMTIVTNPSTLPTDVTVLNLEYFVTINNIIVEPSEYTIDEAKILSLVVSGVSSVYDDASTRYGSSPYVIGITVNSSDKLSGCVFTHTVPSFDRNRFSLIKNGDVYSISYTPLNNETFLLSSATYRWRVNKKVVQESGTFIDLSNKKLIQYTDDTKAFASVEIVGSTIKLKTEDISIERNKYEILTTVEPVINGNDFYLNYTTVHNGAENMDVNYYIDGLILSDSHSVSSASVGKTLTTTISQGVVPNINFDSEDLSNYISYQNQELNHSYQFNISSRLLLNNVEGNVVSNSFYNKRNFTLDINNNLNYSEFLNKTLPVFLDVDNDPLFVETLDESWQDNKRTGLIFTDLDDDGISKHYILNDELVKREITHNSLVNKDDIYVNDEPTIFYLSVADISIDFVGDTDLLEDHADYGVTLKGNELNAEIAYHTPEIEELLLVEFRTGFVRQSSPIGAKMILTIYAEDNGVISFYGLEKIAQDEYVIYRDDNTISHKFQLSFDKSFHIRMDGSRSAKYFTVVFDNCKQDGIGIKDLVVTTRRKGATND